MRAFRRLLGRLPRLRLRRAAPFIGPVWPPRAIEPLDADIVTRLTHYKGW